jgi:hypothetical protein
LIPSGVASKGLFPDPLLLSKGQTLDLGKLIDSDVRSLLKLGWRKFVASKRQSDLYSEVHNLPHPAAHYLDHLHCQGAKVTMITAPWSCERISTVISRGAHKSSTEHIDFLEGELTEFVNNGQWVVLPALALLQNPHLSKHL